MPRYTYKGFTIYYDIMPTDNNLYQAEGYVCFSKENNQETSKKFHTEHSDEQEIESEIKRLLENYIDFEWNEFLKMDREA